MESPRERLKFEEVVHSAAPDGMCRMAVRLEWRGTMLQGLVQGADTEYGRMRSAAAATLEAVLAAAGGRIDLELMGVKAVRAFDGWVVVARLQGAAEGRPYRLLGSASCENDDGLIRAAALTVLDATNRLMERFLAS
ncbi:MAG: hypothetical protein LJF04_15630 [Gemmatimonadetes bacterium]|nr:hypothetical protein [Gemmatimonadota bacterium]